MANTFKVKTNGAMPASSGTADTVYTVPSATQTIVIGLTLCNIHTAAVTASVKIESNTSDTETNENVTVIKDVNIPTGSSLEVLSGGKYVLQAKRYTRVVDVASVRDLYGTVMNEGANRGILITTSSYGSDSYEFAKNKPISLIDGANLTQLLKKHGKNYKIDLKEARDILGLN